MHNKIMERILFIHSSLGGGGAERVLVDILKNIDTKQYQVDLLLIYGTGVYMKDIPNSINYIGSIYKEKRPFWKWFVARLHLGHLFEKSEISKKLDNHYDTIVSFIENGPFKYHSLITDKADRNISWVHTDLLNNHYSRCSFMSDRQEKKAYQKMDTIVFVSETAKDNFQRLFDINNVKLEVIHNPIDVLRIREKAEAFALPKDKFTLCMVGRICPQKRYDRLIEAVKILYDKGCEFCVNILGTGQLENEIRQLVKDLGINDIVNFYGFQSNPYPYIKQADVFCLSSDTEGFPTVICEAMTLGTAVVATNIVGSRDLIGENEYGLLANTNPHSFADALYSLYKDPTLLAHYEKKSLERAKTLGISEAMNKIYSIL